MILTLIFFASLLGLAFPYAIYPLVLKLLPPRVRASEPSDVLWPKISVIVAAYNEAASIAARLENLLAQDYPGAMEILVASDASSDATDEIVSQIGDSHLFSQDLIGDSHLFSDRSVRLVRLDRRSGKSAAQNLAVEHAAGDVLVFTDASVTLLPGSILALVRELADPTVGCVSGEDVSVESAAGDASAGAGAYTGFEIRTRRLEIEKTGTLIGVSGCLFAVRKILRPPVPPEAVDDLYVPLHVVSRGFRVIAAPAARAVVRRTASLAAEFRRKVRTFTGALFTVAAVWKNEDRVALRRVRLHLLGHKLLRWLGPQFALLAFLSNALLAPRGALFLFAFVAQCAVWLLAIFGTVSSVSFRPDGTSNRAGREGIPFIITFSRLLRFSSFFLIAQSACALAWFRFFKNTPFVIWSPTQRVMTNDER